MENVVIAGGGPTGLMLACELKLAGVDVLVLERLAGPSGESRAGGIHARTMEILDQRGLLGPFLAEGRRLQAGHFAGLWLDFSGLETRYPYLLAILQRRIERLLEARAVELGVWLRREVEVVGLRQDTDGVDIETDRGESIRARYLVGCDGGRSAVRRLAGIDFPGTPATMTAILGDVELALGSTSGCTAAGRSWWEMPTCGGGRTGSTSCRHKVTRASSGPTDTSPGPRRRARRPCTPR